MTFHLSTRTKNGLLYVFDKEMSVDEKSPEYAALIAGLSRQELMRTPGLGRVSVDEIEQWLSNFGLSLVKQPDYREILESRERAELARLKAKYEAAE